MFRSLKRRVADMNVLFVCSGNIYRSPVAEALLKKLRPGIVVESAGIRPPLFPISEDARKYLAEENAQRHLKKVPEGLKQKDLSKYDLVVAMETEHKDAVLRKCPECEDKTVVWNIEDPYSLSPADTAEIFDQIKNKVAELANSL